MAIDDFDVMELPTYAAPKSKNPAAAALDPNVQPVPQAVTDATAQPQPAPANSRTRMPQPTERRRYEPRREREERATAAPLASSGREMPWSEEAEHHVIACALIDGDAGALTMRRAKNEGITSESFFSAANRLVWETMNVVLEKHGAVTIESLAEELKSSRHLEAIGGIGYLVQITSKIPTTAHAGYFIAKVREKEKLRAFIRKATGVVEQCYSFAGGMDDFAAEIEAGWAEVLEDCGRSSDSRSLAKLEGCKVDAARPPPEPETRLSLAGKPIATPGNLVTVIAKAKSGKTATVGGMLAAMVANERESGAVDALGFTAARTHGRAVVVLDTEQSRWDAHACLVRSLNRARCESQPAWLYSYGLAGWSASDIRSALPAVMRRAAKLCGGIFAVVVDGVGDLVDDVNDPKECNPLVAQLHSLAIEFDCPLILVIHSNEGRMAGDDGRGHLGKQLTRKAESNLLLRKVGDVTTITSEKQRKAPITEADGVAFKWSDQECRHVSCGVPKRAKDEAKRRQLMDLAAEVFSAERRYKYRDLVKRIMELRGGSDATAERRVADMRDLNVLSQVELGFYEPVHPIQPQPSIRPQ